MRRLRRLSVFACLGALALGVSPAAGDSPAPAQLVSDYETPDLNIHRDGGMSVPLPEPFEGQSLFLFGDTALTDGNGDPLGPFPFIPGGFAAIGPATPGVVPTVREVPTPGEGPISPVPPDPPLRFAHFLPRSPQDVRVPGTTDECNAPDDGHFGANWPMSAHRGPDAALTLYDGGTTPVPVTAEQASRLVFVLYLGVCVPINDALEGIEIQRVSIAAWDVVPNEFVAIWDIFDANSPSPTGDQLPGEQALFNFVFTDTHLFGYSAGCDHLVYQFAACAAGYVHIVRAPLAAMHDEAAYEYWTGAQPSTPEDPANWSTARTDAVSAIDGATPINFHVGDFAATGDGYLLAEQWSMGMHYRLWQSSTPTGPWTQVRAGVLPGCPTGAGAGCYGIQGHAELSTGSELMYSFHDMTSSELEFVEIPGLP